MIVSGESLVEITKVESVTGKAFLNLNEYIGLFEEDNRVNVASENCGNESFCELT